MVASAVIAAGALVALPGSAAADSGGTVSSSEIASALTGTDRQNGSLVAEPVPSKTDTDSAAVVKQDGNVFEVPKNPEDGVSLQSDGTPEVSISLPNAEASGDAKRLKDGTVAYPGTDGSAQAVIPTDGGVQMLTTIADKSAPTRYDYKVEVPEGGKVELLPDNAGAVVLDGDGNPVIVVPAPWAKDANGTAVPTRFETDGTTLTQVVEHTSGSYSYPVVADPFFKSLINAIGGCVGWASIGQGSATALAKRIGRIVVTKFIPFIGWASCAVGAYAAW